MKDKDITKALECCTDESYENCNECPYSIDNVSCERMKLLEDSLDLINRQQAENERLQKKVEELSEVLSESIRIRYKEAKSEAVKEFTKRLKEKSFKTIRNYGLTKDVVEVCDIDNLVKEMEGEDSGQSN